MAVQFSSCFQYSLQKQYLRPSRWGGLLSQSSLSFLEKWPPNVIQDNVSFLPTSVSTTHRLRFLTSCVSVALVLEFCSYLPFFLFAHRLQVALQSPSLSCMVHTEAQMQEWSSHRSAL